MMIKGINEAYFFEIEKTEEGNLLITVGDFSFTRSGVVLDKKHKKSIIKYLKED